MAGRPRKTQAKPKYKDEESPVEKPEQYREKEPEQASENATQGAINTEQVSVAKSKSAEKQELTLCSSCEHFREVSVSYMVDKNAKYQCNSQDAPITGFIYGLKEAMKINTDGKCQWFEARGSGGT